MLCRQPVKTGLDYGFGFRARDKDAGAHLQVEVAERRVAGDVLERLAFGASGKHGVEGGKDIGDGVGLTPPSRCATAPAGGGQRIEALPHQHGLVDIA